MTWTAFLLGLIVGVAVGVVVMAALRLADDDAECRRCGEGCLVCQARAAYREHRGLMP